MEGKPEGNDFNSSLKTKNSNEVWFCVILEGRKGKVSVFSLAEGGMNREPARSDKCTHFPSPLLTFQHSLPSTASCLELPCPKAFARKTETWRRHLLLSLWPTLHTSWTHRIVCSDVSCLVGQPHVAT